MTETPVLKRTDHSNAVLKHCEYEMKCANLTVTLVNDQGNIKTEIVND